MRPSARNATILGPALGAAFLGVVPGRTLAQAPSFTLVGYPTGGMASRAYGLSADGSVATGYSLGPGILQPGYTWTRAGGRYDFGFEAGIPAYTETFAIAGDGSTVTGLAGTAGNYRAFRWQGPGTYQNLGTFGGYPNSRGEGVNGDGSVVVGRAEAGFSFAQAFRWTQAGGMQGLGFTQPAGNGAYSEATGVSRDGNTVVGWSADIQGFSDAFVWTPTSGLTVLPQLPGTPAPLSYATAVNLDGTIIVGVSGADGNATIWRNGQPSALGVPPGWSNSYARAVNDYGSVVACSIDGPLSAEAAGIWTLARGIEPLVDYLAFNGINVPPGWSLLESVAVSGDGLTLAGWAQSNTFPYPIEGYVARVPGPSASIPFALGLLLGARRRRRSASDL